MEGLLQYQILITVIASPKVAYSLLQGQEPFGVAHLHAVVTTHFPKATMATPQPVPQLLTAAVAMVFQDAPKARELLLVSM